MIQGLLFLFWASMFLSQSLMDLLATVLVFAAFTEMARDKKVTKRWPLPPLPLTLFFAFWLAVLAVGLFVIAPPEAPRWKNFLEFRWILELGLWVYLLRKHPLSTRQLAWFILPPLANAIFGLITWIVGSSPLQPGEVMDRIGGFFSSPMPFAHSMGPVAAILGGVILVAGWRDPRVQRWLIPCFALISLSVLLSMTRGIWVGLFAAALILPVLSHRRKGWILSASLAAAAVLLTFSVPTLRERALQSFNPQASYDGQRITLWQTNLEIFKDHPLVGLGYSENGRRLPEYFERLNIPADQFKSHAHNQYIHFLSGTGLLGLGCYLIFLGFFLWQNWLLVKNPSGDRWMDGLALGLLGGQIVFEIGSMTESNFSIAKNRTLLLFLMASVMALKTWRQQEAAAGTKATGPLNPEIMK